MIPSARTSPVVRERRRSPLGRAIILILLSLAASAHAASFAPERLADLPGVDGTVSSMARSGHTLYLAGSFGAIGTVTGGGVPVDASTGAPVSRFARISGTVDVAIQDGEGGWFVGGYFSFAEGEARRNLAHVLANGDLAPWAPRLEGEDRDRTYHTLHPTVHALARHGNQLYVGGLFQTVDGRERSNLAAIDTRTGSLLPWNPGANGEVRDLVVHEGTLYAAGYFSVVAGQPRGHLAAFDLENAYPTPWNPNTDAPVLAMAISGRTMFLGGVFNHVGSIERASAAAVDLRSGLATDWNPRVEPTSHLFPRGSVLYPYVQAVAIRGNTVYLGGWFLRAGGRDRSSVAAVDARTGEATSFGEQVSAVDGFVGAMALGEDQLYVGGWFGVAGGQSRPNVAGLDLRTGAATVWNPRVVGPAETFGAPWDHRPEGTVSALAFDGERVFTGGTFNLLGDWQTRYGMAAIDLVTRRVLPWSPTMEGISVNHIAVRGASVYLAGSFRKINDVTRRNAAAVDGISGELLSWDRGNAYTLLTSDQQLYVGGALPIDSQYPSGGYFAPVDPVSGLPSRWLVDAYGGVEWAVGAPDAIYLGGQFGSVAGKVRGNYAALDPNTGAVLPWAPRVTFGLGTGLRTLSFGLLDETVYLSGRFVTMNGERRGGLAAVDRHSADLRPWAPEPDDLVLALGTTRSTVWAGGRFSWIGGREIGHLAALDAITGEARPWDAQLNGEVGAIDASGDAVCVGGSFRSAGGFPAGGLLVLRPAGATAWNELPVMAVMDAAEEHSLNWSLPARIEGDGRVEYALDAPGTVSLSIFDVTGRKVETLVDREWQAAGMRRIALHSTGWASGIYFCRFQVGDRAQARKFVVVK